MPENNDFIDRKVEGATKIFGMADKNVWAFMLTISMIFNIWLFYLYTSAKNETVSVNNKMSQMVIEEVRKQVTPAVQKEVTEQVKPIAESVDTAKSNLVKFIERIEK